MAQDFYKKEGTQIAEITKKSTEKENNTNLYTDYSIEKAKNGKTSFKEHRKIALKNGLSPIEAFANALASKMVEKSARGKNKPFSKSVFRMLRHSAKVWDGACETVDRKKHESGVVKRYLARCDSLVKKASFIISLLKEPFKVFAVAMVVIVCGAFIVNAASYDVVLGVYADGELVGYLNSKSPMSLASNAIQSDLTSLLGTEYKLNTKIEYSFVNVKSPEILNDSDCYRILYDIASADLTDAYALYIDGKYIASTQNFDELNQLLKSVQSTSDGKKNIKNNISIVNQHALKSTVKTVAEIAELLHVEASVDTQVEEINSSRVTADILDESYSTLDVGIPRFTDGNPKLTVPKTLSDGTKITTDKEELLHELNLVYIKEEIVNESIPFAISYIESDDYYTGTQLLKTVGREGQVEITYEIEYDADGVISKTETGRRIVSEPITEVIVLGTSAAPTKNASGSFIWPTDAPVGVSSEYGGRMLFGSYDFHRGIDIPNWYGCDIWAADSGVVTYAGYNGSYGYYVQIDHGDGINTLYAHCSRLYVSAGDEVVQGDVIAAIGSTGVATADHLHFEITIDGAIVNPADYLPET